MLTRQGWLAATGTAVLLVGGRILGLLELFALGVVVTILLIGCAVVVHSARLDLEVGRVLHPSKVHVGTPSRVEISVRNRRSARSRVMRVHDPVSGTSGADLLVPPLDKGERTVAAYRLPTDRRGIVGIGALQVIVVDPFGLMQVTTVGAPAVQLTVLPRVDELTPLPYTTAHDPQAGIRQLNALGRTGEEFYALRPYVIGDDLRRVHWPTSARMDELVVRQNELPWQGRTTVLLDVRQDTHDGESIEVAVSAAASVVMATSRRDDLLRLVTTDGSDSGFGSGTDHVAAAMEHLAVVQPTRPASLRQTLERLAQRGGGGALVAIVSDIDRDDLQALQSLRGRYGSVTIVQFDRSAWDPRHHAGEALDANVLHVTRDSPFAETWNAYARAAHRSRGRAEVAG